MTRRTWLMMVGTAAVWGASYMFIKVALDDFSEGAVVCIRTALGAGVLLTLAARWGALGQLRGHGRWIVPAALVQVAVPFMLITFGENHVDSQLAGILVSGAPIFMALLALLFVHAERVQGWSAVGIVIGMLGVVALFGLDLSGSGDQVLGGLMILAAAFCYAVGAMLIRYKLPGVPPVAVAGANMSIAALVSLPLFLTALPAHAPSFTSVASLVALGVAGTGLAFLWFYTLIAEIGPQRASIIAYISPGFSVFYGVTLLGEPFTVGAVVGLALILAGSWLAVQGRLPAWAARAPGPAAATMASPASAPAEP
jgi:drug/metabolite transporter (DMT)-like permease